MEIVCYFDDTPQRQHDEAEGEDGDSEDEADESTSFPHAFVPEKAVDEESRYGHKPRVREKLSDRVH